MEQVINVPQKIQRAMMLGEGLEALLANKTKFPAGDRDVLLLAYWSLIFDYHKGILLLLREKFYGSAFTLIRPSLEVVIRAHVAVKGSESDIRRIQRDRYRVDFSRAGRWIDKTFGTEQIMQDLLQRSGSALHGYTHAGIHQLGRRFDGNDIAANYSNEEILEVIRVTTSGLFMVTILATRHFGFDHEWERANKMYAEAGTI